MRVVPGRLATVSSVLILATVPARAANAEWDGKGEVALEARGFLPDGDGASRDWGVGLATRLEVDHKHRPLRERLRVFGRLDAGDRGRNVVVVEEAWVQVRGGPVELAAGMDLLNWSATEAFHPADVLNSRNLDSNVENFEKLGEPMASLSVRVGTGAVTAWYLPLHVAPRLPSARSRLSLAPSGVAPGKVVRVRRDGRLDDDAFAHQWAVRVTQSVGVADVSLHFVDHVDRHQPVIGIDPLTSTVRPVYLPVRQAGGSATVVLGSFVLKTEAAWRRFTARAGEVPLLGPKSRPSHVQLAFGAEYGLSWASGQDSTFILEGQGIAGPGRTARADLHPFQADVLLGLRHAFNDADGKEVLASLVFDVERREELLLSASYTQRLTDTWSVRGGVRAVIAPRKGAAPVGLERLHEANQLQATLVRYF
jgi:hypothetical protein